MNFATVTVERPQGKVTDTYSETEHATIQPLPMNSAKNWEQKPEGDGLAPGTQKCLRSPNRTADEIYHQFKNARSAHSNTSCPYERGIGLPKVNFATAIVERESWAATNSRSSIDKRWQDPFTKSNRGETTRKSDRNVL